MARACWPHRGVVAFGALLGAGLIACGGPPKRSRFEEAGRLTAPLPACVVPLAESHGPGKLGMAKSLREEDYWGLVFAPYDRVTRQPPADGHLCTGERAFADGAFVGATPLHGSSFQVADGDVVLGSGGDRLKVVWLRSHHRPDGTDVGVLAVVRPAATEAEVIAAGVLQAHPDRTRLAVERMGSEFLVTATDEGCKDRPKNMACHTTLHVFLPRLGTLRPVIVTDLEAVEYGVDSEPGMTGRIEYKLTATPRFRDGLVEVTEQVRVTDAFERELRKAELNRTFSLQNQQDLVPSDEPLFGRIVPASASAPRSSGSRPSVP